MPLPAFTSLLKIYTAGHADINVQVILGNFSGNRRHEYLKLII